MYKTDTMGYAFTYPLVHYFTKAKIATYTHYPTISSDMVNRVHERRNSSKMDNYIWSTGKLMQVLW
jgi:alpha-1,2-mannosyltransferase